MKKILVVDDTKHLAKGLSEILEYEGFKARFALDGVEAMTIMKAFVPDLVVTDLRMAGMDGLQLIKAIRKDDALGSVPIIVLTANGSAERKDEIIAVGANLFVTKPFDDEKLIEAIKMLLDE